VINATGLGSLNLADVRDMDLYPTRGQTVLVAEPRTPVKRMYEFERKKYTVHFHVSLYNPSPLFTLANVVLETGITVPRNGSTQTLHMCFPARWAEVSSSAEVDKKMTGATSGTKT
jgi:hypothetical protein